MFARLKKQVLEDGVAGPSERLQFSPRKLPGGPVAVRSPPEVKDPSKLNLGEGEIVRVEKKEEHREKEKTIIQQETKYQPLQTVNLVGYMYNMYGQCCIVVPFIPPQHPTVLPSHLKSSLTQEAVHQELLARIQHQQQGHLTIDIYIYMSFLMEHL